jgi:hypothetical protein
MKNNRQPQEITTEDFDSLFMWKVFRKLVRSETPFVFCLKVILVSVFFVIFILSLIFIGTFSGN